MDRGGREPRQQGCRSRARPSRAGEGGSLRRRSGLTQTSARDGPNSERERAACPLALFNLERSRSMKAPRDLRRFILIKSAEGNQAEIRSYVTHHLQPLSLAFHVEPQTLVDAMASVR